MTTLQPIYEVNNWARVGTGRELQFFATDSEVKDWLLEALPRDYAPYKLIGSDLVKLGHRNFVQRPFSFPISAFPECLRGPSKARYNFWLHSETLTPALVLRSGEPIQEICCCNGLVLLQHGLSIKLQQRPADELYRDASRIALVDRLKNLQTGELRITDSYVPIYTALSKVIRDALVYSTVFTFADGHAEEDTQLHLMTEGAARSYRDGFLFTSAPGQRIQSRE